MLHLRNSSKGIILWGGVGGFLHYVTLYSVTLNLRVKQICIKIQAYKWPYVQNVLESKACILDQNK